MRLFTCTLAFLAASLALAPVAPGEVMRDTETDGFSGRTSDGLAISFRLVTTTTVGGKPRRRTVTRRITAVKVRVNSFCSNSGPRVFTALGAAGSVRKDGSFTARGGGVAVRGKLAGGRVTGTVSEFQRFGSDVCRGAVYFAAS